MPDAACSRMDRALWRSARQIDRCRRRLDQAHPLPRDAQLCAAGDGKLPGLQGTAWPTRQHRARPDRRPHVLGNVCGPARWTLVSSRQGEERRCTIRTASPFQDRTYISGDGLTLHLRDYDPGPAVTDGRLPVICLPGLTRNSRDFHALTLVLSSIRFPRGG